MRNGKTTHCNNNITRDKIGGKNSLKRWRIELSTCVATMLKKSHRIELYAI